MSLCKDPSHLELQLFSILCCPGIILITSIHIQQFFLVGFAPGDIFHYGEEHSQAQHPGVGASCRAGLPIPRAEATTKPLQDQPCCYPAPYPSRDSQVTCCPLR